MKPQTTFSQPLALACSLAAILVTVTVLFGWLFHVDRLVTLLPGLPAMAVPTALGLLLSGAPLGLQGLPKTMFPSRTAQFSRVCGICVILIGVLTLAWFFLSGAATSVPVPSGLPTTAPINRTSPNSSVNLILIGLSLCLMESPWRRHQANKTMDKNAARRDSARWPYQMLALIVLLNAFLALLGQFYGVTLLFGLSHAFGMALPTAIVFLVVAVGVLSARPDRGFVAVFISDNVAGQAARRLLPVIVAVPIILGGITLLGFRVAVSFAMYLLVVASIGTLVSLFWSTILTLHEQVERDLLHVQQLSDQSLTVERLSREEERNTMLVQQRRFVREMLASVTEGKLNLCDSASDLPQALQTATERIELRPETLRLLRRHVMQIGVELRLSTERLQDLVTACGEAGMNSVKHGGGGTALVRTNDESGTIQVWIEDKGAGIRDEDLHRATLEKGWSSAGSFGHGFYLMLRTVDRTYLLTSAAGTTVVLEQERTPPQPAWL